MIEVKPPNKTKNEDRCEKLNIARISISNVWEIQFTQLWNFELLWIRCLFKINILDYDFVMILIG